MATGIVYLVGAGPGDLGLVTLRAKELIASADVLVYDYLVHPDLLDWCRADAKKIYVGKKAGFHSRPQDEIEAAADAWLAKITLDLAVGDTQLPALAPDSTPSTPPETSR